MESASHESEGVSRVRRAFWKLRRHEIRRWPDPHPLVDEAWDPAIRRRVADHLKAGIEVNHYAGISRCRICGVSNGATDLSDATYLWPEGLAHYVGDHRVRLPSTFVAHVLSSGAVGRRERERRDEVDRIVRAAMDHPTDERPQLDEAVRSEWRDEFIMGRGLSRRPISASWWIDSQGSWDA